nr:hypothetical protein [Tanacetum cinerariifolium]
MTMVSLDSLAGAETLEMESLESWSLCTPPVSAGSTPPRSPCASPISADRHSISAGKSHVPAVRPPVSAGRSTSVGRPTNSAGRPVSTSRPSGSAARTPVPADRILGKVTESASSDRFPRASSVKNSDIHNGLTIFDCPKSGIFTSFSYDKDFSGPDANNLESSFDVSSIITKRIHTIHPTSQVIGDINSPIQTRSHVTLKGSSKSAFISYIHDQRRNNHLDFQLYDGLTAAAATVPAGTEPSAEMTKLAETTAPCESVSDSTLIPAIKPKFSNDRDEPTSVAHALADPDWVEAMQAKMQQFRNQKVWVLVKLPDGKRATGTKWILKNKRDARGIVCRNKARVLYGKIAEEVYVTQPRGFEDPDHPKKVYKVVKALYGLHQAPRAWKSTTGGCQFLGRMLISWQCKKQTIVATYSCEAEYVAVAS